MSTRETINCRRHVLQELKLGFTQIKENYKYIKELSNTKEEILGSGEWLLDNIYLIEKEYKSIKENMPMSYFDNLPKFEKIESSELPRILIYAKEYIKLKEGAVKEKEIIEFINQKQDKFTIGELWAFPLMLRIAIIINLSKTTKKLVSIQEEKVKGKYEAYKIIEGKNKNRLDEVLGEINGNYQQISGLFLESLERTLRDNSIEDSSVWELIRSKSNNWDDEEKFVKNNFVEASIEQSISTCISSLREIEGISWRKFFNLTSKVEEILVKDPSDTYNNMDFKSKDYYRHRVEILSKKLQVDESKLAEAALELALKAESEGAKDYRCHIGYYLVDDGVKELGKSLNSNAKLDKNISSGTFVFINFLATLTIVGVILGLSNLIGVRFTLTQWIISILLMLIPANEIVVALINWSVSRLVPIRFIPKLKYEKGIPKDSKAIIVVPAIIPNKKRAKELMEQLEVAYNGNRDNNIYFALLGDFKDYKEEHSPLDQEILNAAIEETEKLNKQYFPEGEQHFFFLNRKRIYNTKEGTYLGKERKRGKLMEFMALLKGDTHTFNTISSDISNLKDAKYIITLDADTFIPRDTAHRLIGAMSHILNSAVMDGKKVRHGYGIIQPKVSISLESKNRTKFSRIFAGEGGIDGYSVAYSETYQDLFGEGSFTGKGIIDIDVFYQILKDEIPENTVLSHDLLEGAYTRCSLATDIEVIDNYPFSYEASSRRLHRWIRGDWQLLRWLFSSKVSLLSRWKIFDNLRRSLLAPNLLIAVLLNLTIFKGESQILILCFLGAIIPVVFTVTDFVVTPKTMSMGTLKSFEQIILIISFIPYQAYLMLDGIVRTLYRLFISRKNLLQWQTAEEVEVVTNNSQKAYMKRMWASYFAGVVVILLSLGASPVVAATNIPLALLWIISPYLAYSISQKEPEEAYAFTKENKEYLRDNARRIWAYYEDFVNLENNYLAPDNYQEKPYKGVAYRTSPTNIGMGLMSNIVAYDMGYLPFGEVIDRLEAIIDGMSKLQMYNGHYFNWYDTRTCEPLWPRYISTVDSGNLIGYLWIISKTLVEYKNNPLIRLEEIDAIKDTLKIIGLPEQDFGEIRLNNYAEILENILSDLEKIDLSEEVDKEKIYWIEKLKKEIKLKIAYYEYVFDGIQKFVEENHECKCPSIEHIIDALDHIISSSGKELRKVYKDRINALKTFSERVDKLIASIDNIIKEMDFKFLYDEERGLFAIGYNLEEKSLGKSYYDLLASESRATSFITIALNQIPKEHWFNLSRAMTNAFKEKSLVSWSGTMFEYFMPTLIMKSYKDTLLSMTYSSVINSQKEFAKMKGVPWGISESAFYQFDLAQNYQYKAFGVPGIGLKRGLEDELVVSPYSTLITIPYSKDEGIENLKKLATKETYGRYGFIEAIDYTPNRVSKMDTTDDEESKKDVRCYMVHHLGMSLMALDNALNDNILQKRFHSMPEVKATELLLKERIPSNITFEREENFAVNKKTLDKEDFIPRVYEGATRENPEVLLLSNGSYSTMLTLSGSGYGKKDNMTVYRWKGDSTADPLGSFFYIKNLNSNDYWSAAYEPCKSAGEDYTVEFSIDKGTFKRKDGSIDSKLQIVVSPEDDVEIRKLTLKNTGEKGRSIEITSYMEVTLQSFQGDAVHPGFSNLFISTEYNEENGCLLGSRRARVKDGTVPFIFHKVISRYELEGAITYETSRLNFIGRNRSLKSPQVLDNDAPLLNTVGTVLDPIMSLRSRIRLEAGEEKEIYYITGTTNSKEEALEVAKSYEEVGKLEKAYNAYSRAVQLELKGLGIKSAQANIYQRLASYILFLHSGRSDREEYIKNIKFNQQDLWAYGISGDLPIAMVVVQSEDDMDLVRGMIKMHYYWKSKGLKVDLLIYNEEEASYEQPLQRNIMSAISLSKEGDALNKPGGVFVHNKATLGEDIRDFIIGIASLYVDSSKGSIITQIRDVDELESSTVLRHKELMDSHLIKVDVNKEKPADDNAELLEIRAEDNFNIKEEPFDTSILDFWNGYGGFDPKDSSYVIRLDKYNNTPAPWINVVSNDDFGFHISEVGSAYTWCGNSRENKITPWSNDWVTDPQGEAVFIRDNDCGTYFSVTPKPVRDDGEYIIRHSFGYSTFKHTCHGIRGEEQVFCPKGERLKIQRVKLENLSNKERNLSVYYYAQLVLGVINYESGRYITTSLKDDYIMGENPYSKYFGKLKAYLTILGGGELSFTGDRKEFIGVSGEFSNPKALKYKKMSNRVGSVYDPCLAVESKIKLAPGEKKEIIILLGQEELTETIKEKIEKYTNIQECEKALENVKQYWAHFLGNIQVKTNDKSMDYLLNGWLLYQTYSCRYLSRTAFYQSGGAYGFRDQLQDSMSLGIINQEVTKSQIIRSASRQYLEGDVQHWWHPVINSGIRTRFSDDLLWLPYVTTEYIKRTGDYSILNEKAKYLEDEPLAEGEDERYTIVNTSNQEGSIYEHCIKAIEQGLKFGEHNIPLMGSGDWNDGMSTVGNEGKGESVWLGWFLYKILDNFDDVCSHMNDKEKQEYFKEKKEFIRENLEKEAWDGGWYRRAYFDDGTPLGSRENEECQMDSLAQSWALISGASTGARAVESMEAVDKNLVKDDKGMILLLTPPFEKSKLEPGYIKGYVAGVRENGGQYTHAAVWVILALTKLGLGDKALKYYNMINPINHANTELECNIYKAEPYVMAADVYIREPHGGRGGWSWYTGASGWMYKVGLEDILGLKQVQGKGYKIEPCIPKGWGEYTININNETEEYEIKVIAGTEDKIIINGEEVDSKLIPKNKGKLQITAVVAAS
ncbi:glycosyl transferase [Clostridium sp. SHJSY1]|uniref:GH36-type glycosyl hydrolase domain-containing protein n=1 Tax=Clostridium sp. SHJSY1 TaxID=2942483 RepID=UPI0028756DDA|nr:glucoamylase family protein [Clostridium sp. SHJSY1]MDS0526686.1 glycosyl transferase [Clostridium sp. SHJSY1]